MKVLLRINIRKAGIKIKADKEKAENVMYLKTPIKINKTLNL